MPVRNVLTTRSDRQHDVSPSLEAALPYSFVEEPLLDWRPSVQPRSPPSDTFVATPPSTTGGRTLSLDSGAATLRSANSRTTPSSSTNLPTTRTDQDNDAALPRGHSLRFFLQDP
eukprot:GSA25T00022519001.1